MRVKVDFRTVSKEQYRDFCSKHPNSNITWNEWRNIIYTFNENFKFYILETGLKARLPGGFGEFSIQKRKRKKIRVDKEGVERINLPINWAKTKEKGKYIYEFNYHTEGFSFRWKWFKKSARVSNIKLWYFKPSRVSSRLINHYLKTDRKYQHLYQEWK